LFQTQDLEVTVESTKSIGRVVGLLLLIHLTVGLMAGFILLEQVRAGASFMANAAGSPVQFRTAVLLLFSGSAMAAAVALTGSSVFRRHSPSLAQALLALGVAAFTLQVVDAAALMAMLALSEQYAKANVAAAELYQTLATVLSAGRRWVHYSYLLVAVSWILLLNATFFRLRLVPRFLAALAMATSLLQMTGVTVMGLLGNPPVTSLAIPLAPAYFSLAVWLLVKGFDDSVARER
jgi:Domain of unknown function (DUF4386)